MNQKIITFYRLNSEEKDLLIEQCRKRIEEEKIKESETVRKILEELLETRWETKKKTAQTEMQKLLDDLQRQITEVQARERRKSTDAGDLQKKLDIAELRNKELNGDLALANGKLNNFQERLKVSEMSVASLAEKLTDAEKMVSELQGKLTAAEKRVRELTDQKMAVTESNDTLRQLYTISEKQKTSFDEKLTESEKRIKILKNALETKEQEAETNASQARLYQEKAALLEKKLIQESEQHEKEKTSAEHSFIVGILLAAVLCVSILWVTLCVIVFPTQHITSSPVSAEQNAGVSGTYTGGGNVFDCFSGFGELCFDNGTVCRGFWANGAILYATEYVFPDGGVYSGVMCNNNRPFGVGTYTRLDGEEIFGFWTWAHGKIVKIGVDEVEYSYTGPLRFGKPYGYGVFDETGDERRFVGEYYDDIFRNGTWIGPDRTPRKVNSQ